LNKIELKAHIRTTTGNGPARALRREGMIPAVIYGPKTEPVKLSINTKELENSLKGENIGQVLFNLSIGDDDATAKTVMIKELQTKPISGEFIHADFYEVDMDRKIIVSVPVVTVGKSKGVELGGILQIIRRELDVLCYPGDIPEAIEIDITEMEVGDSLHVEEIPLEENIEIPADVNFTVATVLSPKVEEVEEEEEEGEELEEAVEGEEEAAPDSEE
jgi:large subunit ribosomal protein L25